jgi:Polyphosphate kinase C-terminal domain 2
VLFLEAGFQILEVYRNPGLRAFWRRPQILNRPRNWLPQFTGCAQGPNGGEPDIFLGSADWMPRNLYERVEVMFPVKDSTLRNRILDEILQTHLKDNEKSRILHPDGTYGRVIQAQSSRSSRNGTRFNAQAFFVDLAEGKSETKLTVDELQSQRAPNELPAAS